MIPVRIQTLIVTAAPAPSIIVLQPVEETQNGKSRVVPIWIGAAEAAQMGVALEKARFTRPMTHDLFLDALTNLDARVDHVVINDVKGPTFFARLALRQGRLIELDARPSDALSLAVRQEAPIYIEDNVLERASFPYLFKKAPDEEEEARGVSHVLGGTGARRLPGVTLEGVEVRVPPVERQRPAGTATRDSARLFASGRLRPRSAAVPPEAVAR